VNDGRIVVRLARAGERLETLDHVVRDLTPDTLIIADPKGPIGIAGVMGGAESEIGSSTTEVVIESAIFDPISIRRTAFHYALPLRGEPSLREGSGAPTGETRGRPDGPAHHRVGWRAGGRRRR
jgi:phenylalanyl-tRNA synthetase beta chain